MRRGRIFCLGARSIPLPTQRAPQWFALGGNSKENKNVKTALASKRQSGKLEKLIKSAISYEAETRPAVRYRN
jgi:hypothetical protein